MSTMPGGVTSRLARRTVCVSVVLSVAVAAPAAAHPYLVASTPQAGVVDTSVPNAVQIGFTEGLTLGGCSITVRDQHGRVVHTGRLKLVNGGDGLSVPTGNLAEGIYTVSWVAYGDDGHTVAGSYKFGVPSAGGQPPPGAGALLATTTSNGSESAPIESPVSLVGRWLAAIGAFVLLGGAALLLRLRGRVDSELVSAAARRWRSLALASLGIALLGTVAEAVERSRGPGGGLSLALLTGSSTGLAVVVRLGVLVGCALALRFVPVSRRPALLAGAGACALAALAVDGHVATVSNLPALAAFGQMVHLVSAGLWVGGVIVLAACLAPVALAASRPRELLAAARSFTVIALPAAVLTCATGIVAAVTETRNFYFLRWSTYGNLVIVKVLVVAVVLALGGLTTLLARRALGRGGEGTRGRRAGWLMRGEALAAISAAAVASVLAGTLQARGQPLPAQRGQLLPGAGFADVALEGQIAQMTLAPARPGLNRIVVAFATPSNSDAPTPAPPHNVSVSLSCACGGRTIGFKGALHPGAGGRGAWYTDVGIPLSGVWSAQLTVDHRATIGSPTFNVGVPHLSGSTPVTIASVADLSGPDALDCRTQELGALYSIELMNVVGGLGGSKITQELLDDGGNPALARSEALQLAAQHPAAFLAPCGQGASAAIQAVGNKIPTVVADPNVPVTPGRFVYRFAPDPYSEGYAAGQYIVRVGLPTVPKSTPRRVAALVTSQPDSQQRLRGLEAALAPSGVRVQTFPPAGPGLDALLRRLLPSNEWLGIYLDGQFGTLARALNTVGNALPGSVQPTAIMVSSRLSSERFVIASGQLGAEGQVRAITDVDPGSVGAQAYTTLAPQVVGELPTLPGLSGFVAGQALAYGMVDGDSPDAIAKRLQAPGVFSRAAVSPWSDQKPASGTVMFQVFVPVFLTSNLIPAPSTSNGGSPGEVETGTYFADGDWEGLGRVFSPLPVNLGNVSTPPIDTYLHPRAAAERALKAQLGTPAVVPPTGGSAKGARKP